MVLLYQMLDRKARAKAREKPAYPPGLKSQRLAAGSVWVKELDMVINIGRLRSNEDDYVYKDIAAVVEAASGRATVKVILENAYLTNDEKVRACKLAEKAGAHFVKTSTGFAPTGATLEDIDLMRKAVSPTTQIKAAQGVRTLDALLEMMQHGATRIGTSATQSILEDFKTRRGLG